MDVSLNPRENGACPLCSRMPGCRIRQAVRDALSGVRPARASPADTGGAHRGHAEPLEMVIYSCPQFKEKP